MSEADIQIIHEREALRRGLAGTSGRVGVVLIQGPLHYRHLANITEAASQCEVVIAAALAGRDKANYLAAPEALDRPVEAEAQHIGKAGATYYFVPSVDDMYPYGAPALGVSTQGMPQLERTSVFTEEYFSGVIQFYAKLFSITGASDVYVSQKDLHELAGVRQFVRDFDVDIEVHPVMVPRDPDGLASDVVNHELDATQREQALAISKALYKGVQVAAATGSAQAVVDSTRAVLEEAEGVEIIEVALLDPLTLAPATVERGTATLLVLARVGGYVLSDNMLVVLRRL
ncbi:MAG: pantoate--beta-alanine ligase [Actinomycetaceae bacterium]|nr:pantoate--beta-alanine ligase [Actinomycetaceae bacterium]MDU0969640.1 pantoate--beta-alanine ligase [Actinomycetaceae bacterium]